MNNGEKKFRVSKNKRNSSALAFGSLFLVTLFIENGIVNLDDNIGLYVMIAVIVGVISAVLCIVFVKEYYMQIHDDGFELVKGRKITKYDFSDFAGSHVTRHYMNGIYTGTSREISIKEASGKTLTINANNLSKDRFAELVTYLGQARFTSSQNAEASAEYFKNGVEFRIPNTEIIKANKNKFIRRTLLAVALLAVFFGMLIYYAVTKTDSAGFMTVMLLVGLGGAVNVFLEVIPAGVLYHKMKNLPDRIFLDEYTLVLGDQSLGTDRVLNIMLVPANYDILTRDVIIVTRDNAKYKFNFGKKDLKKTPATYSDYDKLCNALELWCIVNHINFMQILG